MRSSFSSVSLRNSSSSMAVACVKRKWTEKRMCFVKVREDCRLQFPSKKGNSYAVCLRTGIRGNR
jgi:hypothetical protein